MNWTKLECLKKGLFLGLCASFCFAVIWGIVMTNSGHVPHSLNKKIASDSARWTITEVEKTDSDEEKSEPTTVSIYYNPFPFADSRWWDCLFVIPIAIILVFVWNFSYKKYDENNLKQLIGTSALVAITGLCCGFVVVVNIIASFALNFLLWMFVLCFIIIIAMFIFAIPAVLLGDLYQWAKNKLQ